MSLMSTYFASARAHWVSRCFVNRVSNLNLNSTFTNTNRLKHGGRMSHGAKVRAKS